eukprot:TRINITY_DN7326_c0_g1_i10.p1 TRINITY_DN7326_c0_g1~~TRINITY_DN7326_c0_g1_i10.p1  ORF type:complete len:495 (-),score=97.68 TRINITY_DN7326_c0_g1_i10:91-1575(-)
MVKVKIQKKSFAQGAMRAAYRMEIISPDGGSSNWVAKGYLKPQENEEKVLKDDVILQMSAAHYGNEYSKMHPPKQVYLVPAHLIRMINRPKRDFYCIEPAIEGEYVKYNTNTGFIESLHWRNTPHAFSHFTFEHSNHQLMVVDMQGVGDMYTDPQIHSAERVGISKYGNGNLGVKGIALFLYTHQCNPVCKMLGLKEFVLYDSTVVASHHSPRLWRATTTCERLAQPSTRALKKIAPGLRHSPTNSRIAASKPPMVLPLPKSIPMTPDTVAYIHYEIARYHLQGRLAQIDKTNYESAIQAGVVDKEDFDLTPETPAAFFHFQLAAHGGCLEALLALANIHGSNQNVLQNLDVPLEDVDLKIKYLGLAADRGSQEAAYYYARTFYLGKEVPQDFAIACKYLTRLIDPSHEFRVLDPNELYGWEVTLNIYELRAQIAEMLAEGGHGILPDKNKAEELYYKAAEEAMKAGKGKLSMKYHEAASAIQDMEEDDIFPLC